MALEINNPSAELTAALEAGMQAGVDLLLEKSNELAPYDDGDLHESGQAVAEGTSGAVGYSAEHAVKQHERLDFNHPRGGQAKFLETAMLANASEIQSAIAEKLRDVL